MSGWDANRPHEAFEAWRQHAGPTHLKAQAGDKRSLCGIKEPLPYSLVKWAPDHRYPHERCAECYEKAGLSALLNGTALEAAP